mmetsp:Transcript_4698/g.14824  ORF Transcript_4698/g.14824 Transcript_4698/m.14824 type:complete len:434 (+) Transcript_4698:83-1384(+)|eukprot:scaffold21487_cov105-Isochrysis_galbana.AAC.5
MTTDTTYNPNITWYEDRSIFVGSATPFACAPGDEYSMPGKVLFWGSVGGAVLFFFMWLFSGLGEAATGERPLAQNHMGTFFLIPPFFVAMGAVIGWRVIDCTLGCSSWAESAPSISFLTANIMFEGYVLLFVMLVLIAYIFFERVDEMARNRVKLEAEVAALNRIGNKLEAEVKPHHLPYYFTSLAGEWLMRWGFALTTITGIMPSLAGNCHMQPTEYYEYCYEEVMSAGPHTIGIAGGIFLTFLGFQLRAVGPITGQGLEKLKPGGARSYAFYTLVISELTFFLMLAYFVAWGYFLSLSGTGTKRVDVCILHETMDQCTGASLPPMQQRWADQRQGGWKCRWDPNADFYQYPCTKFNCDAGGRVTQNKYSVIFEFLGFLYWAIASAGMTQAIDIMDDIPAIENPIKKYVKQQRKRLFEARELGAGAAPSALV